MGAMNDLISPAVVAQLRDALVAVAPTLRFASLSEAEHGMAHARLRQRVDLVRDALLDDLPAGFTATEQIVTELLDEPRFSGWMIWPVSELVAVRALESGTAADFDTAMALLRRLTVDLTGEFAVRSLLIARPERGLSIMRTWTGHDDENVRRLATEGSRPLLPWAKRVPWLLAHPRATRDILDASHLDPSPYVRRSVANHLNDLSRVDADVALELATSWSGVPGTASVLRRGLRTLVKQGDRDALALTGFTGDSLDVSAPRLVRDVVQVGADVEFSAEITNRGRLSATVAIDYSIGFRRADGSIRPKTFKLAARTIPAGQSTTVVGAHSFRPLTTRTHYPGAHSITVQANGTVSPPTPFTLTRRSTS